MSSTGILLNLASDNRTADSIGTDDFTIEFSTPIDLGDNAWECSTVETTFYNTNPNVSGTLYNNNFFDYSPDGGVTWKTITFQEGIYNTAQLNAEMQRQIAANGDVAANIQFVANTSTLRIELTTVAPYEVDLGTGSNLYLLLGFSVAQIAAPLSGFVIGANRANLNRDISQVYLRSDIVGTGGSYDSKIGSDIIDVLGFQGRPPGASVLVRKNFQQWIPVKRIQKLQSIRIRFSDQLGRRYSLRDEPVSVILYLRPAKLERNRKIFEDFATGIKGEIQKLR